MVKDIETRIRERAHGIWESEGRPEGRAEAHWLMAAGEVFAKPAAAAKAPRRALATAEAQLKRRNPVASKRRVGAPAVA
jgi:hypothetical protein